MRQKPFTLIEMLVVVAIIAILAAMLSPSLMRALSQARGIACANNVRQVTMAQTLYAGDNREIVIFKTNRWPGAVRENQIKSHNYFAEPYLGGAKSLVWLCPGNPLMTEFFNGYNIYGMYNGRGGSSAGYGFRDTGYDSKVNGDFIHSPDQYNVMYRTQRVRRPSEQALYADTVSLADGAFEGVSFHGRQWYAWCPSTLEENAGVHALHLGGANFSYFDGSVRMVKERSFDAGLMKVTRYVTQDGAAF